MKVQKNGFLSIEQLQDKYLTLAGKSTAKTLTAEGKSFQEILEGSRAGAEGEVKFSKHAAGRLADRNIELTGNQIERLREGAQKAQEKGIRESLVIVDQLAFIVNIPNNTVVTAMNHGDTAENIFTNIDGAVII